MGDLCGIVRAAPDLYLLLAPSLIVVEVSERYLAATKARRQDVVGRPIFEVVPDAPDDSASRGVSSLCASLQRVLHERRADTMPVQRYLHAGGGVEDRFWKPHNAPVIDDCGRVEYILYRAEDVTEAVQLYRYRELLEYAPDALVLVGEDGRIRLVNGQTEALFGYRRDELIGAPVEHLIPARFHARHARHVQRFFAEPTLRPTTSGLELYGRRKDGSELPIEVSLSPQHEAGVVTVSASIRDISERLRYEAEARLSADRLRNAVDNIQDALALFDADDRLITCNSAFQRFAHAAGPAALVGKPYPEILDTWIWDLDVADAARERFRHDRLARRPTETSTTFDIQLQDGHVFRVMDRRTPDGGIIETIWDITDDERRTAELRAARTLAETASAAKSEFLSAMSHELRTPLNAVLGFAQLLLRDRREPLSAHHRERVEHIIRSGEHLLRLIDDVLNLAKIESGRLAVSPEPVPLEDVIDELVRTLEPIASRQGIALEVQPTPWPLPWVTADRTRLMQILINFGSNAIKYNRPAGRVRIELSMPSAEDVRVVVVDTGLGIPHDKQASLFQPFERAGQEAGAIEGTGIGLVISKRLAELMKGKVGFRSVPNEGSEFWIDLPLVPREPTAPRPVRRRRKTKPRAPGERHLVLSVEDHPANVMFMRDLMSTIDDIELITVPTAELAIELARTRHPELVLMDINLPGMTGADALRALRSFHDTNNIPIIALTAAASDGDRQRGIECGFYRYLSKPVNVEELFEAIDDALDSLRRG